MNDFEYVDWREYYTQGQMLQILAAKTNTDIPNKFQDDIELEITLAELIFDNPETFKEIVRDLTLCVDNEGNDKKWLEQKHARFITLTNF